MTVTEFDAYGFDLGKFRYRAAQLVKCIIRAREQIDRGFLGEDHVYSSWHLESLSLDCEPPEVLLDRAARIAASIADQMIEMGGSGGVPVGDPLGDLKLKVAVFADCFALGEAASRLRKHAPINWKELAQWDLLPAIRSDLDKLPHPRNPLLRDEAGGTPNGPHPPGCFYWNGISYELRGLQFKLVSALWMAEARKLPVGDLPSLVWGDESQDIVGGSVNSACHRTNRFFKENSIGLRIQQKKGFISLVNASSMSAGKAKKRAQKRAQK